MVEYMSVKRGLVWSEICLRLPNKPPLTLDGISNAHATSMSKALFVAKTRYDRRLHIQAQLREFDLTVKPVDSWGRNFHEACNQQLAGKRWLTQEFVSEWAKTKPGGNFRALLGEPEVQDHLKSKSEGLQAHVKLWQTDIVPFARALNEHHLARALIDHKDFFDTIEKSPLTGEQAKAVVSFDSRMLVVASAGSGKTSTMVAKAAYALRLNIVPPEKILLLAFNNEAAKELQQRVRDRLTAVGLPAEKVVARTFHAFGLDVIGAATGKKPRLAPWLDQGRDMDYLMTIVDRLKDRNPAFRTNWELFRMVLGRDLPSFGKEEPEDWDPNTKTRGFRTLQGDVVKSQGERMIADWLFYNGVAHRYESAYSADTADATHGQYRPDFYYPDIDTYHEHWALDANGKPPDEFVGYLQSMAWKREVHRRNPTALIETTSAQLWSGEAFRLLAKELTTRGIKLDPNPDRPAAGKAPIENQTLLRTFRTFLTHAKSNQFSGADLRARLASQPADAFRYRHEVFLSLFEAIRNEWEASLIAEGVIDFEEMLIQAADHLEAGRWNSPFELVMVDEFQDASRARARLTRALVSKPHRYLFAVGDDWQSINRFAGADLSVMTDFEQWFGKASTHRLERTFRCPQSICDVSSKFVLK
ncbi:DNA helicase-4 [Variovorax sp. OV700]|nr:DNA helicase-4 [Variovorax sp. OV700]